MNKTLWIVACLVLLVWGGSFYWTSEMATPELDGQRVMDHASALGAQALEGRLTGTSGNQRGVEYIWKSLQGMNLGSGAELTRQSFTLPVREADELPEIAIGSIGDENESLVLEYGRDFEIVNTPRNRNIEYTGDLLVVTDSLYELDPQIIDGRIVVTSMNRVTDEILDDLTRWGAVGILNNYTTFFDPQSYLLKDQTGENLRVDWKRGDQMFMGSISGAAFNELKEIAKDDLVEDYSNIDVDATSAYIREKVTGVVHNVRVSAEFHYPITESDNIILRIPGKSAGGGAVVISADLDGYGRDMHGRTILSPAQGATTGILIELARLMAESGRQPEQTVYLAFLNGSKQGDYGMRALLQSLESDQRIEWHHLQSVGGRGDQPIVLAEAGQTRSERQWALLLKMQLHGEIAGVSTQTGLPSEAAPGFERLAASEIPHIIYHTRSDRLTAMTRARDLDYGSIMKLGRILSSYLKRDILGYERPDYIPTSFVSAGAILLSLAVVFWGLKRVSRLEPGTELFGNNLRYLMSTGVYKTVSGVVFFSVPALLLILLMVFLLLFPKMFVMTDYHGLYTGFSPYVYGQRTVRFVQGLFQGGFAGSGQSGFDAKILSRLAYGSFKLIVPAILLSTVLGLLKGIVDSYRPRDMKNALSLAVLSVPDVLAAFLGLHVIILWSKSETLVQWIPAEDLRAFVMPVIALSLIPTVYVSRLALIAVEQERHRGYVKGALAKGATRWQAFYRHLFPVMVLKILDAMPSVMKIMIANMIIVEYFYGYPGIANYLITHMDSVVLVLLLSMGIGLMYLALNAFFKAAALMANPVKRRGM